MRAVWYDRQGAADEVLVLGRTLLAVVERRPDTLAIVDGERRLSYAAWYCEIGRVAGWLPSASPRERS